jgi:sugar lactone lactonase YvrE
MLSDIECLVAERFGISESPVWDGARDRLYWTDNTSGHVHAIDLASRERHMWTFPGLVGSLGLTRSGRLLVAWDSEITRLDPDTNARETLASMSFPPAVWKLNDGKVGPDGAFWVGAMAKRGPARRPVASLYRVSPDGGVATVIEGGILVSNGLAWSPDGARMYHSDSQGMWIDVWDFDAGAGTIANRRRLATLTREKGFPDGAATDIEGHYWSAGFTACAFNRFAPDGTLASKIPVPCACSMPCFGGADMRTVFFTSLSDHVTAEEVADCPLTGGVFVARAAVAGVPVPKFAD